MSKDEWSNWDTWEAYNHLTSYEHTYNHAMRECKRLAHDKVLRNRELRSLIPNRIVNKQKVDFNEIAEALIG